MKATKKSLAFVLALVMMLTLVPMSAFASTSNEVTKVMTVAADKEMPTVSMDLKVTNASGIKAGELQTFKLTLQNAEWKNGEDAVTKNNITVTAISSNGADVTLTGPSILVYGDNSAEISFNPQSIIDKDGYVHVEMDLLAGTDAGEIKVVLESIDSLISGGTYVIATIAGGDTVAKVVNDPKKLTRGNDQETATIEIREAAVTSVTADSKVKLTLPKGVAWNAATTASGTMIADIADWKIVDRDLTFTLKPNGDPSVREALIIKPSVNVTRDAKQGDIDVQVRCTSGDITDESGLVVAVYDDDAVSVTTVKEKDIPEIVAGFTSDENQKNYTVKVILEEVTAQSLIDNKYVEFQFPEWVQVPSGASIKAKVNGVEQGIIIQEQFANRPFKLTDDNSVLEWTVDRDDPLMNKNKTNKIEFEIPVTVEAGHTGDLEVTVTGPKAGVSETKLVVAKLVQPITADVKLADVRTGIQSQKGGEILIKETATSLIRDDKNYIMTVEIDSLGFEGGMKFDDAKVEVVAGDLEIGKMKINRGVIEIPIERSSIKTPGEIKISDVEITLDRTLPEGKYAVKVAGNSVIDNAIYNDDDFTSYAVKADYANIITRADGNIYGTATFKLGEKGYSVLVNGELQKFEMDTAAFTKDQRTMIPVKYVMLALGGTENDVVWNEKAQTATFFKGDRVCVIKIGSNIMTVNGAEVVMDTAAFVKDQRTFVPIKFVATALGCTVNWDAATETVTINQ